MPTTGGGASLLGRAEALSCFLEATSVVITLQSEETFHITEPSAKAKLPQHLDGTRKRKSCSSGYLTP